MGKKLFVWGSLRKGRWAHPLLWGAPFDGGTSVSWMDGEVYDVGRGRLVLLDVFEWCFGYTRMTVIANYFRGKPTEVEVYAKL